MGRLTNEFSWSKSRDGLIKECPRKYNYHYYGSWEGWLAEADPKTRELYILKKLTNRKMWAGGVVHDTIEALLNVVKQGGPVPDGSLLEEKAIKRMRSEFRSSRNGAYRTNPKSFGLVEHEYGHGIDDEEWRSNAEDVKLCIRNFLESDLFAAIKELPPDKILAVEQKETFDVDGVRVWSRMDYAADEKGTCAIYDWKTGDPAYADGSLQLACYLLFAMERWNYGIESIETAEYYLKTKELIPYKLGGEEIEKEKETIRTSVDSMRSYLKNRERNEPLEEDRFPASGSHRSCGRCNYLRPCKGIGSVSELAEF